MKPWRLLSLQLFPAGASHQDHRLWLAWPVLWRLLPGGIIVALFFLCGALSFLIESPPGLSLQHRPRFDLSPCSGTAAQTPPAINQDNGDDGLFRRQTERRVEAVPCPESPEHPLGTDREGQDILLSLWAGLKVYFPAVLLAPLLSLIIGVILGTLMGYPQPNSHVARTCHALSHSLASVPRLLAIVFVLGALGRLSDHGGYTPINVWTVLGVLYAPRLAERVRLQIERHKTARFLDALRVLGIPEWSIIGKHILLYNCLPILAVETTAILGEALLTEALLAFVGFGVEYPSLSWGCMAVKGLPDFRQGAVFVTIYPSIALCVVIVGFFMLGDGLSVLFGHSKEVT